jgi:hypothetical protein
VMLGRIRMRTPTMPHPAPWEDVDMTLPASIPTMISREERRYLRWLGQSCWTGRGHVVEVGPWLGGSTYCLCTGLRDNPASRESGFKMHVYDAFEWRAFMSERAPLPLKVGDSFLPYFEENLRSFEGAIVPHRRVLPDDAIQSDPVARGVRHTQASQTDLFRWDSGPIQILFVDGAKSWDGFVHLLRETGSSLVANESIIVCQDYKHWGCYWVPALCELLKEQLTMVHVLRQNTVAFRVTRELSSEVLRALPSSADVRVDRVAGALSAAAERLERLGDVGGAASLRLGRVRFLGHRGELERAVRDFAQLERQWPAALSERALSDARKWLSQQRGSPLSFPLISRLARVRRTALRRARKLVTKLSSRA